MNIRQRIGAAFEVLTRSSGGWQSFKLNSQEAVDFYSGGPTDAGVVVSERSALGVATVFACVSIISETVASLPFVLKRKVNARRAEDATDHRLHELLTIRPNRFMSPYTMKQVAEAGRQLRGNGYVVVMPDGRGGIESLLPLDSSMTYVERIQGGLDHRIITTLGSQTFALLPSEVVHLKGFSYDGIIGLSPIRVGRETIANSVAGRMRAARTFANGGVTGWIKHPKGFGDDDQREKFRAAWDTNYANPRAAGKTAVLEKGMEFHAVGMSSVDQQLIEVLRMTREDIAAIYRVPPHMVGEMGGSTFSNIEEQSLQFVKQAILRLAVSWEEEMTWKLLTDAEIRAGYHFRVDLDEILRGDIDTRTKAQALQVQTGLRTRNEVRWSDRMPADDPAGDNFLRPVNLTIEGEQPDPATPDQSRELPTRSAEELAETVRSAELRVASNLAVLAYQWSEPRVSRELTRARRKDEETAIAYVLDWWDRKGRSLAENDLRGLDAVIEKSSTRAIEILLDEFRRRIAADEFRHDDPPDLAALLNQE